MNYCLALSIAFAAQSGGAALKIEPLSDSSPIVQEARKRGVSVAVGLPDGARLTGLPPRQEALDAWAQADWRFRRGGFVFLARGSQDFLPRDFGSLDSRHYAVVQNVRTLLSYHVKSVSPTSFLVASSLRQLPPSIGESLLNDIFTGVAALPKDADQAGCGLTIRPGYIFTDVNSRKESFYFVDRLPRNAYAGQPIPPLERDNRLEVLRASLIESIKPSLPTDRLNMDSGIYPVSELLTRATGGTGLSLRLDRRFQNRRILVVLSRPPSRTELLHSIAQALDLYPRNLSGEWFLGVSPGDPREFFQTKRQIEMHNCMVEILRACYRSGTIPGYIPPETFLQHGTKLSRVVKARLFDDLMKGGVLGLGPNVLASGKSNVDLDRFDVTGYVSICLSHQHNYSRRSSCATYP